MTAPTLAPLVATVLAALPRARARPQSFVVDETLPGLAGVLVVFKAPSKRPSPSLMRAAFADALDRARRDEVTGEPFDDVIARETASGAMDDKHPLVLDRNAANAFLASLPEVVTPVAALGIATRIAVDEGARWVHVRTAEKASKWTYCAATVSESHVSILGNESAEAHADGRLVIDSGVPAHIATQLREAYDAARGVVEPSRVIALVASHLVKRGARAIMSDVYLLPRVVPSTCGVLAGLVDLGGYAETLAVADPARIARLSSPVQESIEEQIAKVTKAARDFIERAKTVAQAGSEDTLRKGTGETVRAALAQARADAAMWRDRLQLATLDVDAELGTLDAAADEADRAALAALEERRKARKAAKDAAKASGSDFKAIDEEQEAEERREGRA